MILKYSDNLYLLATIDIIDRYDILLLEVRHLQKIIIDALHAPTLFLPLRREEKYLFGGWVDNPEYERILSDDKNFAKVASLCVTRYPSPNKAVEFISETSAEILNKTDIDMTGKLLRYIGHVWAGDLWVGSERIHYHALRALQVLKQQMLRDKLIFLSAAHDADIVKIKGTKNHSCKMSLMILRRGVIKRMNEYIRIFRTHQQHFGKSSDFGLQSYPRPGIERRRDIGIYNDFLSNRTYDLHMDMQHFIKSFLSDDDKKEREKLGRPIILHGWSQSPKVKGTQLYDDVGLDLQENEDPFIDNNSAPNDDSHAKGSNKTAISPQHVSYVDTSFWSPDRPDLQPLVAKYVARSLARNYLGKINDKYLSNHTDNFSHLLTELSKVVAEFVKKTPEFASQRKNYRKLVIRHLSIDLLAATTKGIAFLYAEFLAIAGEGLENQLRTTDGYIKLEMSQDLIGGVSNYEAHFLWYFRLRITSFWLSKVIHTHCSTLDTIVIRGTRQVCDDMLDFLDENIANVDIKKDKPEVMGVLWKGLAEEMEQCIARHSFVTNAKKWRKQRSEDTWCERRSSSGEKRFHRSNIRLDIRLQNFMFEGTLDQKSKAENKPLSVIRNRKELQNEFDNTYGMKVQKNIDPADIKNNFHHPRWLYRHLHQIPFQCAILRSIDLLGYYPRERNEVATFPWQGKQTMVPYKIKGSKRKEYEWPNFVKEIHMDMSLGREKFALGLEFYTWSRESPRNRLALSNNLLVYILPQLDKGLEVKAYLENWLRGEEGDLLNKPDAIREQACYSSNDDFRKLKASVLIKIGAETINRAFSLIKLDSCKETRRLEQLAGYKLKKLLEIYEDYIAKPYSENEHRDALEVLLSLGAFLKIRATGEKEKFYDRVLNGLSNASGKGDLPERIAPMMLSRAVITNPHSVANPFAREDESNQYVYNTQTLHDGLTLDPWTITPDGEVEVTETNSQHPSKKIGRFCTILGRYDVVSFVPARMPCKCRIPSFGHHFDGNEHFINHFTRREIALPVNILPVNESKKTLFAIISISLQRRAMRLSLLYRIMSAIKPEKDLQPQPMLERSVEAIHKKYASALHIQGYLTDGWGDLLLVFELVDDAVDSALINKQELVDDIFQLQQMFYEDFMVDRTELIYTPKCIDYIATAKGYNFSITVRMMEDRKLEASVRDFMTAFEANRGSLLRSVKEIIGSEISQTPGRTDLTMRFTIENGTNPKGLYKSILDWLSDMEMSNSALYPNGMSMLGKVETIIERSNQR